MLDERKHFLDLMTDAFKTQGHTSLQSRVREIKMTVCTGDAWYSTLVKELREQPEQRNIGADISGGIPDGLVLRPIVQSTECPWQPRCCFVPAFIWLDPK